MFKTIAFPILLYLSIASLKACSLQRCCLPSTCTSNYCITRNSETWISTQNFANFGYTKLVLAGGQCVPCSYNCQACSSETSCTTCAAGFYSSGGQCLLCSYACLTCQVSNGISKCSSCSTGTYLDSTTAACKNCATGASACSSATVITSCKTGYLLTSNSLFCLPCPANCASCPSSDSLCSSCSSGYYLNSSKCFVCTVGNCSTCAFLSSKQTCTLCMTGFVLSSGACSACPTNCQTCSNTTNCTRCSSGYYLMGGGCLAATTLVSNCNLYSSSAVCSSCLSGYYLQSSKCQPCSMLCTSCYGLHFGQCTACATNAVLFNQMCLPINYIANSQYQLYYSYPSSSLLLSGGSIDCNRYLYSGTSLALTLTKLAASQIRISWRLFSIGGSTTYSVSFSTSTGTAISTFSTSSSSGDSFTLCSGNTSATYSTGRESSHLISVIKYNSTLTFSTNNGINLALQQVLVVADMCNSLCVECSSVLCTQCELTNLYTQDAYCVYTCSSGYYIFDNLTNIFNPHSCVQQCPVGTYPRSTDLTCALCVSPCLSCLNDNYCLSCIENYFLTEQNTCVQNCPYRYFGELLTQTCSKCVGRCDTCLDQFRCLSCSSGFFYAANYSCLDSCSPSLGLTGLYASLQTLNCQPCSSVCLNCIMEKDYCTSCSTAFVFYNYTCFSSCPSGYYSDADSICQSCSYPCETCQATSSSCTSCLDRYLLSNSCIASCPSGYFQNNNGLICSSCSSGCSECINSAIYCTACQSNYYYFNNTCVSTCPERYFGDSVLKQCIGCSGLCYKCSNDTFCLACTANFLWEGSCVTNSQCPKGYYAEIDSLSCQKCDSSCETCQFTPSHCTSCNQNSSLVYLQDSKCLPACSSQLYYATVIQGVNVCAVCTSPCSQCLNSSYCLTCQAGYMLSAGVCSTVCTAAYYFDSSIVDCSPCTANCLICNTGIFCQLCKSSYYISSINSTANQCVDICPSGFYANTQGGSCQPCLYPCLQCSSSLNCLSCQTGILYLSRCISSCPDTTFYDASSEACSPCAGSCLTCMGSATYCLSCQETYYLYSVNNTCLQSCIPGTYAETVTQTCLQCPSNCLTCINSTYCVSCPSGRAYLYQKTHNCITSCPLGYFGQLSQAICLTCDEKCLTCRNSATNCLSCVSNFYLVQLSVSAYDCVAICPKGYFNQSQSCKLCIFPCQSCSSASNCLSCVIGTYYYPLTSSCLLSCPSNSYLQSSTSSCQLCSSPCVSCKSSTHCLSCTEGLFLNSGSCVSSCPSVTYADTTKICLPCSGLCKTCSSLYYCTSCLTGYLSNGFCYDSCPPGTYANLNVSQCVACISPCVQCAFSAVYCTRCLSGLLQYQGNCSSSCPLGTFISDGSCLACSFPCINCSSSTSCHECLGGYLLYNQITCIDDVKYCPNDFFKMDGKYCIPEVQCSSAYYKDYSQRMCSAQCSPDKYVDEQTKTCNYNCKAKQYVSTGMVCRNFTTKPSSLMGISVISFIKSSVINLVVSFNQTQTWLNSNSSVYSLFTQGRLRLLSSTSGSELLYTLNSDSPKLLLLRVTSMPSELNLNLPAHNVISSASGYPLQTPNITVSLPTFVPYDYSTIYQGYTAQQFGQGLGWFIWLLTIVFLFKNRISHLYVLWDTVQLIYMLLFLDIQYPPTLNQFMVGLNSVFFQGFPNIFPVPTSRMVSDGPFYAYSTDNSFLRNAGAPLTLLLIVIIIYIIFKAIQLLIRKTERGKAFAERFPQFKKIVFQMLLRYRWHYASDVFFLTYSTVCLFGVAELVNASSNPDNTLSNVICGITLLFYVAFPIFVSTKLYRHFPNIKKGRHVQNLRCFYRGIDKTSQFGIFLVVIRYFRKILYALVVGVFSSKPMYAVPILMMVSGLIALFIFVNLPYKKRLSNIVQTITQLCIAILYLGFALINFNNKDLNISLNVTMGYLCTALFIFILLLEVFEVFCRSLFKLQSEQQLRKKTMNLNPAEEEELRKKAAEFFDFMFPRIRKDFGMEQDSEDEVYHYEQGDSQNSQNNQQRQRSWGIDSSAHSEQFRHYDNNSQSQQATEPKQPPEYLVRCVKEIQ